MELTFQGNNGDDELSCNRSSSIGCSSRISYYCMNTNDNEGGAVPFKWEMQPGTPKSVQRNDVDEAFLPPLSPPPALRGVGLLPTPNINNIHEKPHKPSLSKRVVLFWKRDKKNKKKKVNSRELMLSVRPDEQKICESEYTGSSRSEHSRSSSSLSLPSTPLSTTKVSVEFHNTCTPWNFTSILRSSR
ncbi:hypothetical protein ACFE04_010455 [Oxalis oulophora]